ncbi:Hypothetical protein CINCED_3A013336 [Cinara cedri]|nr:Hypothetical protein CINCED_3A013336 [Cinara cedri]
MVSTDETIMISTDENDCCGCGHCMTCCYQTVGVSPTTAGRKSMVKRPQTATAEYDDRDPPPEAAAFMASASAAAVVLIAAFLAIVLSSAALWTFTVVVPMAHAAVSDGSQAAGYLREWQQQQRLQQYPLQKPHLWQLEQQQHKQQIRLRRHGDNDDALARVTARPRRQLFNRNANREPGIVSLTFSLIGGTITDARQAYRNVSNIVRDTISEAAKIQEPSTTVAADGDLMAAGNTVDVVGSTTAATPPVDQRVAGQTLGSLLGRNYRGLRRLFNSELRSAIKSTPGNIRDFTVELMGSIGQSLRPSNIFTRGPINGTSTNAL